MHVSQDLLELRQELVFGWSEGHSLLFGVEGDRSGNTVLLVLVFHLTQDELSTILINFDLSFNNHIVDESNKSTQTLVVLLSKLKHSVLKLILLLLKNHGLVLSSLPHLIVLEVFLLSERSGLSDDGDELSQLLVLDLLRSLVVVLLGVVSLSLLLFHEVFQVEELGVLWGLECFVLLHVEKDLVDVDVGLQEGWSGVDQGLSQVLSGSVVLLEADITLPELEHFSDDVVLEELHASKHVEHGLLLHPVTESKELSWDSFKLVDFLSLLSLFKADVDHTLSGNGKVLLLERLLVIDDDQVVWSELVTWDWLSVAVKELDWSAVAMLGEERDSLFSSFDLADKVVQVGTLGDEVGLSGLHHKVLRFVFLVFNDMLEFSELQVVFSHVV